MGEPGPNRGGALVYLIGRRNSAAKGAVEREHGAFGG